MWRPVHTVAVALLIPLLLRHADDVGEAVEPKARLCTDLRLSISPLSCHLLSPSPSDLPGQDGFPLVPRISVRLKYLGLWYDFTSLPDRKFLSKGYSVLSGYCPSSTGQTKVWSSST